MAMRTDYDYQPEQNDEEEEEEKKTENCFKQIRKALETKRGLFNKNIKHKTVSSKFVTEVIENKTVNDQDDNKDDDTEKYANYSCGVRFYYHPYYKINKKQ